MGSVVLNLKSVQAPINVSQSPMTVKLPTPPVGINGKSAYDIALEHGFVGSEAEWLASLSNSVGGAIGVTPLIFEQTVPNTTWVINHATPYRPVVTIEDSSGRVVEGEVEYTSSTIITIHFAFAFSGKAYLR